MGDWASAPWGRKYLKDQLGINLAYGEFAEIPGNVMAAFQERSRALHAENPLSEAEIAAAQAINIDARVSEMIIAMDAPELLHHLIRNPHEAARLNGRSPLVQAARLAEMKSELDESEPAAKPERRLPSADQPSAEGLRDRFRFERQLANGQWAIRNFKRRKVGY